MILLVEGQKLNQISNLRDTLLPKLLSRGFPVPITITVTEKAGVRKELG